MNTSQRKRLVVKAAKRLRQGWAEMYAWWLYREFVCGREVSWVALEATEPLRGMGHASLKRVLAAA